MIRRTRWPRCSRCCSRACGGSPPAPKAAPTPVTRVAEAASSRQEIGLALETGAAGRSGTGKWADAVKHLERALLEFPPGDRRARRRHTSSAVRRISRWAASSQAAREFRKVSDDTPNDPLAPEALLRAGDAYADLWRRPELDPSYGQTALATYQELLNRYPGGHRPPSGPGADQRSAGAVRDTRNTRPALYYFRLKAYDSAILYLKDLVATYPREPSRPTALFKLVQAYRTLGYKEDVQETCGYIRRFHASAPGVGEGVPGRGAS